MPWHNANPEVYKADDTVVQVGAPEIAFLRDRVDGTKRKRIRVCAHQDNDSLHEMIIVLLRDSYIRPHKHLGKTESLHVIDGEADVVFFDDAGQP